MQGDLHYNLRASTPVPVGGPALSTRRFAPALAAVPLLLAACGASGTPSGSGASLAMGVSESGCDPTALTAQAGQVVFVITNNGTDVAEFEVIGPDAKVLDEAENIVPGFVVNLSTRLDGGTYELVCGNLSAPRGTLTVSGG